MQNQSPTDWGYYVCNICECSVIAPAMTCADCNEEAYYGVDNDTAHRTVGINTMELQADDRQQVALQLRAPLALRMLLLAAEAITYGHYDVAKRRIERAQDALAPLPD